MGSRSIASIPARPAPSARRACSLPAPPSWAYPRKMRSGRTSLRTLRAAMPSAAWWTPRRSRSSRYSWPRIRPGRSPASWSRQPGGPGGRYFTEQRFDYVSVDLFNGLVGHFDGSADARSRGTRASCGGKASPPNFASSLFAHRHRDCPVRPPPCTYSVPPPWRHILLDGRMVRFQVMLTRIEPPNLLGQFRCRDLICAAFGATWKLRAVSEGL